MNEMTGAEKDACDGCQKRPCVCETVALPSAENDRPRVTWADVRAARQAAWEAETAPHPIPPANPAPTSEGGA